jgi:septal ring factor EnvC (AmiA/AmiB activator)
LSLPPITNAERKRRQANAKAKLNAALAAREKRAREMANTERELKNAVKAATAAMAAARRKNAESPKRKNAASPKRKNAASPKRNHSPRVRTGMQPQVFVTTKQNGKVVNKRVYYRQGKGFFEVVNGKIRYNLPV